MTASSWGNPWAATQHTMALSRCFVPRSTTAVWCISPRTARPPVAAFPSKGLLSTPSHRWALPLKVAVPWASFQKPFSEHLCCSYLLLAILLLFCLPPLGTPISDAFLLNVSFCGIFLWHSNGCISLRYVIQISFFFSEQIFRSPVCCLFVVCCFFWHKM